MSLVKPRWVLIAGAGAAAVGMPIWLLQSRPIVILPAAPLTRTVLPPIAAASLDMAMIAPPFAPTRSTALTEPTSVGGSEGAIAPPAPPPQPAPALVGTVVAGRGRAVALLKSADGQTRTLARGEAIDGWTLVRVRAGAVTLSGPDRRMELTLDYGNRPTGSAEPPPIPAPPDR